LQNVRPLLAFHKEGGLTGRRLSKKNCPEPRRWNMLGLCAENKEVNNYFMLPGGNFLLE